MEIKVDFEHYPPNIEDIRKVFNLRGTGTVFTYGDTIYAPNLKSLPDHLLTHENIHVIQQGKDPKGWWKKYLNDPKWRAEQELEAYKAQYKYASEFVKDRNKITRFLHNLASDLSSEMYGNCIDYLEAMKKIKG